MNTAPTLSPPLRLALVAMPGAGKSTVGRLLAKTMAMPFVDLDQQLEARLGMGIKAFFAQHGESAFRDAEEQQLAMACAQGPMVLATGGGAVLRPANRDLLHRSCTVVYLRTSPDELFRRLKHDRSRPLLQVDDPLRKLRELYKERDPLYRRTAHFVIETGRPSVHTLANMILMQLELAGHLDPQRVPASVGAEGPGAALH